MKVKFTFEIWGVRFEFATNVVRVVSRKAAPTKTVTVVAAPTFQPYGNSEAGAVNG